MQHRQRRAALAELDARIAHAEVTVRRHAGLAARAERGGDEARTAAGLLRVARERLAQLERSRDVLLAGDEGVDEFEAPEVAPEAGERRASPRPT